MSPIHTTEGWSLRATCEEKRLVVNVFPLGCTLDPPGNSRTDGDGPPGQQRLTRLHCACALHLPSPQDVSAGDQGALGVPTSCSKDTDRPPALA